MNEMEKAKNICVEAALQAKILDKCKKFIEDYGIALPQVEPLVLDFGLGDFYKTGLIEYWIANEIEAGYCGKYLFVFDGQRCPMHRHKDKHETFFIVKGKVMMEYDEKCFEMKAGDVLPVKQWNPHAFTGLGPALILEISTPCLVDDNHFECDKIPIGSHYH